MITVEQLIDWNDVNSRNNLEKKIEEYVDNRIKRGVLAGQRTIHISTGKPNQSRRMAERSPFFDLWCNEELSEDNLRVVRKNIIEKYSSIGLLVSEEYYDEGWHSSYRGLEISIPKELLEKGENNA